MMMDKGETCWVDTYIRGRGPRESCRHHDQIVLAPRTPHRAEELPASQVTTQDTTILIPKGGHAHIEIDSSMSHAHTDQLAKHPKTDKIAQYHKLPVLLPLPPITRQGEPQRPVRPPRHLQSPSPALPLFYTDRLSLFQNLGFV